MAVPTFPNAICSSAREVSISRFTIFAMTIGSRFLLNAAVATQKSKASLWTKNRFRNGFLASDDQPVAKVRVDLFVSPRLCAVREHVVSRSSSFKFQPRGESVNHPQGLQKYTSPSGKLHGRAMAVLDRLESQVGDQLLPHIAATLDVEQPSRAARRASGFSRPGLRTDPLSRILPSFFRRNRSC